LGGRRCGQNIKPTRGDDAGTKRRVAGIYEMNVQ
jgi:hypothetical protein